MGEFAATSNELVDAHNDTDDDITWIKAKDLGVILLKSRVYLSW